MESPYTSDAEIIDTENYTGSSDAQFSHEALVMRVINKCLEAGCREMRSGWFNEKFDRTGNVIKTYIDDTRKNFIESVKSAEMIMYCDFDEDAKEKIGKLKEDVQTKYIKICDDEMNHWNVLPKILSVRLNQQGIFYRKEKLNRNLPFIQDYVEYEVEVYREILKELTLLTQRMKFYKQEDYSA